MGREGHLLFEADQDINILDYIQDDARELIGGEWALKENEKVAGSHIILVMSPDGGRRIANRVTRKQELKDMPDATMKAHLDAGIAKQLFAKYRAIDESDATLGFYGEYMSIILAAYMMQIGATLDDEMRSYLRELVPKIPSRYGFQMTWNDDGFRDPGKIQFLTALDNYKNGVSRSLAPSCWHCGKTKAELGRTPAQCNRCREAHFCNKECQRVEWKKHKRICVPPGQGRNV